MSPGATSEGCASSRRGDREPGSAAGSASGEGVAGEPSEPGDGAKTPAPAGRAGEPPAADGPPPSTRAERRLRLQGLAGLTVLGSDGKTVGRVRDIYQQDASGELAAITVMPRQLSAHSVLIPAAAISAVPAERPADGAERPADGPNPAADPDPSGGAHSSVPAHRSDTPSGSHAPEITDPKAADVLRLCIDAVTAQAGMRPPHTGHASPQTLREAAEALGLATPAATRAAEDA